MHLEQVLIARRLHALGVAHFLMDKFSVREMQEGLRQLLIEPRFVNCARAIVGSPVGHPRALRGTDPGRAKPFVLSHAIGWASSARTGGGTSQSNAAPGILQATSLTGILQPSRGIIDEIVWREHLAGKGRCSGAGAARPRYPQSGEWLALLAPSRCCPFLVAGHSPCALCACRPILADYTEAERRPNSTGQFQRPGLRHDLAPFFTLNHPRNTPCGA
jgi:hypothetical protein